MVTTPVTHGPATTIAEARTALEAPHRHLLLIVFGRRLLGTLVRDDLDGADDGTGLALDLARLAGRTTHPGASLTTVHAELTGSGERRRAVVDDAGELVGLLCLKASGTGFCSDEGIGARRSA
ncbi:MAG: hypothetical protein JWO46_1549 [Nocardioidaceae bacterium]|nr:hypothetical protein [Nocardioidaceae bacterium]